MHAGSTGQNEAILKMTASCSHQALTAHVRKWKPQRQKKYAVMMPAWPRSFYNIACVITGPWMVKTRVTIFSSAEKEDREKDVDVGT